MTTKDSTGEKLISSIRRTKAGTATAETDSAPAKPAPRRRTTASAKPAAPAPKAEASVPCDPYQSVRRVWPD